MLVGSPPCNSIDNPVISYATTNGEIKLAVCQDIFCANNPFLTTFPSSGGRWDQWSGTQLDQRGYPVVAYYDNIQGSIKMVLCDDASCTSFSSTSTAIGSGEPSSFLLDQDDNPIFSFTTDDGKLTCC